MVHTIKNIYICRFITQIMNCKKNKPTFFYMHIRQSFISQEKTDFLSLPNFRCTSKDFFLDRLFRLFGLLLKMVI